jgi:ferredoxin
MSGAETRLFVCSCERTMPPDEAALAKGGCGRVTRADQLCGAQLDAFRAALGDAAPITVACTQEAPLFTEVAEEAGARAPLTFVNIRETGGWSKDAAAAGPKAAALIAAAQEEMPPISLVSLESEGVILIYGRDEVAIEAGRRLADKLDVTVMLSRPGAITPPRVRDFPVLKGHVRNARGHLGAFELAIDDTAAPAPSSRDRLVFGAGVNGATSTCDIVLDLTGYQPLFPASELRPGYLRADPRDAIAVEKVINEAAGLVGVFDKPRYINFTENLCAHSRSKITGCVRCLDLCPTGAITPNGDHVAIDTNVCAGCGACASVCPTGAASYALPPADALMRRLRALLLTYAKAGGADPVVLLHDGDHGEPMIDALARFGDGLPARVLPLRVNEVTQVGYEFFAGAFSFGAAGVALLARQKPKHDMSGLAGVMTTTNVILHALGFGDDLVRAIETDDPDQLRASLDAFAPGLVTPRPASYAPRGAKRSVLETAFRELHHAAPAPVDVVPLARGAPFGGLDINIDGCTLCHSCVTACPTGALGDNPDRPTLKFTESVCVQCGLCEATCPENVITLAPRLDFQAWAAPARIVKEEEPFRCISCDAPFGTKSTIERIVGKLAEKHWMFSGANARRIDVVRMCDNCRVEAVMNESFDPHAAPQRPPIMTTEDYLRARDADKDPVQN